LKRLRPVASGALSVRAAAATAVVLGTAALAGAVTLGPLFALTPAAYLGLLLLYSAWLKHIVIIDVLTISAASLSAPLRARLR
jgi:4-hydroxybenzoate polyprenyltransferase